MTGTREEWLPARRRLLHREKELTGLSDGLATEERLAAGVTSNFRHVETSFEEMPGISTSALCHGTVHHVFSPYARGGDVLTGAYQLLDGAPVVRVEDALPWTMAWVCCHDEYQWEEVA
jgi:predicted dithiol-disulfide oxidoreductase (DUF899 family)